MEPTECDRLPELNVEKALKAVQSHNQELEDLKNEGLACKQAQALATCRQEILSS